MKPYIKEFDGKQTAIVTEAYIFPSFEPGSLPAVKYFTRNAAWDTGSENTIISPELAEALELRPIGHTDVVGIGGSHKVAIYEVAIGLPNGHLYHRYKVLCDEIIDYEVLFGMDIITETDFLITNKDGKTTFQFRTPSEGGVEL